MVIGYVETHGRAETIAQIGELEQVPRRKIEYRGITLEEMDLDAVIARRPTIALVDELAHTNAPGSRNPKRYLDVEELLREGISVISTLNIQHLESLHDIVERATGVRVKERLPDYVVTMADQIVNVDLSAEDLRERLEAGKIYPPRAHPDGDGELLHAREADATARAGHGGDRLPPGPPPRGRQRRRRDGLGLGAGHGVPQLAQPLCRGDAPPRGPHRRPDGCAVVCGLRADARESLEKIDAATLREIGNNLDLARQLGGTSLAIQRRRPGQHDRRLRARSTASRTSSWAAAASPGIAAGSVRPCSTACCNPCRASTC